jgi:hypothetical protein
LVVIHPSGFNCFELEFECELFEIQWLLIK